jgi:hypothetical protein
MSKTPPAKDAGTAAEGSGSGKSKPPSLLVPDQATRQESVATVGRWQYGNVVRECTGSVNYPTLTRSNYAEEAMVMRCNSRGSASGM